MLSKHLSMLNPSESLITAGTRQLRAWIVELKRQGAEPAGINRKISSMRSFYRYLLYKGVVKRNPVSKIQNLSVKRALPEFVPDYKMQQLLDTDEYYSGHPDGPRDRMIIELFYDTGIRSAELIGLRCGDIDFSRRTITIHGKGGKTRQIPITETLCRRLRTFVTEPDSPLFTTDKGRPLYAKLVYNIVHRYLELTQSVHRSSPHTIRHSFATAMLNNGASLNSVKELLGHESLATTQIYTHVTFSELKKNYKLAHPRALKKGG
jgi:integrase/recombinase XerC